MNVTSAPSVKVLGYIQVQAERSVPMGCALSIESLIIYYPECVKGLVRSVLYDREGGCCRSCDVLLENSSPVIEHARTTVGDPEHRRVFIKREMVKKDGRRDKEHASS